MITLISVLLKPPEADWEGFSLTVNNLLFDGAAPYITVLIEVIFIFCMAGLPSVDIDPLLVPNVEPPAMTGLWSDESYFSKIFATAASLGSLIVVTGTPVEKAPTEARRLPLEGLTARDLKPDDMALVLDLTNTYSPSSGIVSFDFERSRTQPELASLWKTRRSV